MNGLPQLELPAGVMARGYAGEADVPAIVAVLGQCWRADGVEMTATHTVVVRLFAPRGGFDPTRQALLVVDANGQVVAFARHVVERLRDGSDVYGHHFAVIPAWREQGIELALFTWNEDRLRELAATRATDIGAGDAGSRRLVWLNPVRAGEAAVIARLTAAGYASIHEDMDMLRPTLDAIAPLALPMGYTLRPVTTDQFPTLYLAYKSFFADDFDATPASDTDYLRWSGRRCFQDLSLCHVAWSGERVAGMVLCAISDEDNARYGRARGLVDHVGVVAAYRGHGLAGALLARALATLRDHGMREATLVVDAHNKYGAIHLYERAGFVANGVSSTYARPLT
jgi:ribosomal protein S18 acetylase RimI-like enzyme